MQTDTVYSKNKYIKSSARKARLIIDLIRGKEALKSVDILKFTNKAAAEDVLKTLNAAIHNATYNKGWDKKKLVVSEAFIDEAPTFKRGMAVARGRYHQILKRNCHLTIGIKQIN